MQHTFRWGLSAAMMLTALVGVQYIADDYAALRIMVVMMVAALSVFCVYNTPTLKALRQTFQMAWVELLKVTWPTKDETLKTAMMVSVMVAIFAILMWLMDAGLTKIIASVLA